MPSPTDIVLQQLLGALTGFDLTEGQIYADTQYIRTQIEQVHTLLTTVAVRQGLQDAKLDAIYQLLGQFSTVAQSDLFDIKQAIANIGGGVISITLPPIPPPGYGADTSDIVDQVWRYIVPGDVSRTGDRLVSVGTYVGFISSFNAPQRNFMKGQYLIAGDWGYPIQADPNYNDMPDPVDFSTILPTDTSIQAWIERVYSVGAFDYTTDGMAYSRPTGQNWFYVLDLTPQQFEILRREAPAQPQIGPPVWPGSDLVTLGDELELVDQMSVDGPMHGVIVKLTAVPDSTKSYTYDDKQATLRIGALTFVSDEGSAEHVNALAFDHQVYSPRAMTAAMSCKVRVRSGVTGTIQPWLIALGG